MSVQRVTVELQFFADMKDGMEGDDQADAIGEAIVHALDTHAPLLSLGVEPQSFTMTDWTSKEES